jgi:hypothetical protein
MASADVMIPSVSGAGSEVAPPVSPSSGSQRAGVMIPPGKGPGSAMHCQLELLCNNATAGSGDRTYNVTVPAGAQPGSALNVSFPCGRQAMVTVPLGMGPGWQMSVRLNEDPPRNAGDALHIVASAGVNATPVAACAAAAPVAAACSAAPPAEHTHNAGAGVATSIKSSGSDSTTNSDGKSSDSDSESGSGDSSGTSNDSSGGGGSSGSVVGGEGSSSSSDSSSKPRAAKRQRRNYGRSTLSAEQVTPLFDRDLPIRPVILDFGGTPQLESGGWVFREVDRRPRPPNPVADKWRRGGGAGDDLPTAEQPIVRRRFGYLISADGKLRMRYHQYCRLRLTGARSTAGVPLEEGSTWLFHVLPDEYRHGTSTGPTTSPAVPVSTHAPIHVKTEEPRWVQATVEPATTPQMFAPLRGAAGPAAQGPQQPDYAAALRHLQAAMESARAGAEAAGVAGKPGTSGAEAAAVAAVKAVVKATSLGADGSSPPAADHSERQYQARVEETWAAACQSTMHYTVCAGRDAVEALLTSVSI